MNKFSTLRSSAAGSYLGLYALSAISTALFLIVCLRSLTTDSSFRALGEEDYLVFIYIIITWVGFGWLMCLVVGIGFDVLPLIHGAAPFHENAMRQYLITNFAGQAMLCLTTFLNSKEKILEFSTVGISLLCLSIILLGAPGRRLFMQSKIKGGNDEVGVASLLPGMIFPFIGAFVLACWLFRDIEGVIELGRSFIIMFYLLITLIMFLSHFNRRLNWQVVDPTKINQRVILFFIIISLHILFSFLTGRENATDPTLLVKMQNFTLGASMLLAFFICNPMKITKMALLNGGMSHSRPILLAMWMLPFCAFHAFNTESYTSRPGSPGYATFLCTTAVLCVWGYAWYLHEDHLHINIHKRKPNWIFIGSFIIGFLAIQVLFWQNANGNLENTTAQYVWVASMTVGSIVIAMNFVRMTLLSLQPWQRIPMFYGRFMQKDSIN